MTFSVKVGTINSSGWACLFSIGILHDFPYNDSNKIDVFFGTQNSNPLISIEEKEVKVKNG